MNKKILAVCLCFVIACGIFAGCKKKAADPISIIVTDENGVAVTDKNGEIVTKKGVPVTDKDGNAVTEKATNSKGEIITDENGDAKTVIVTEPDSKSGEASKSTTDKAANIGDKVPYSTTAPQNNKTLEEWNFGSNTKVGCNAPNGWKNEAVNQLVKEGTETRVVVCPVNYLESAGYKSADDYLKFIQEVSHGKDSGSKLLNYSKEVYDDGTGISVLYKEKSDRKEDGYTYGKYVMIYLFQTGDRVRTYFVYGQSEDEAKTSIESIIANTYYRG